MRNKEIHVSKFEIYMAQSIHGLSINITVYSNSEFLILDSLIIPKLIIQVYVICFAFWLINNMTGW